GRALRGDDVVVVERALSAVQIDLLRAAWTDDDEREAVAVRRDDPIDREALLDGGPAGHDVVVEDELVKVRVERPLVRPERDLSHVPRSSRHARRRVIVARMRRGHAAPRERDERDLPRWPRRG